MSKRFMRIGRVEDETGKSRSSIYEDMAAGTFPKCFPIGRRAVAWYEEEINEWKRTKLAAACKEVIATKKENPALVATGVHGSDPPEQRKVGRIPCPPPAGPLIARIPKSSREELWVTIRAFNGANKCELRVHERDGARNWRPTPRHLVIGRSAICLLIEHLTEVQARLYDHAAKIPAPIDIRAQEDGLNQTFYTDR